MQTVNLHSPSISPQRLRIASPSPPLPTSNHKSSANPSPVLCSITLFLIKKPLYRSTTISHISFSPPLCFAMKGVVLLFLTLSLALSEIADNDDVITFTDKNADELFEEYNPVLLQFDAPVMAVQHV